MIIEITNDLYMTESKVEALAEAELQSGLQNDFFSVLLVYEHKDVHIYYIKRGSRVILIDETLIAEFEKGVKL